MSLKLSLHNGLDICQSLHVWRAVLLFVLKSDSFAWKYSLSVCMINIFSSPLFWIHWVPQKSGNIEQLEVGMMPDAGRITSLGLAPSKRFALCRSSGVWWPSISNSPQGFHPRESLLTLHWVKINDDRLQVCVN